VMDVAGTVPPGVAVVSPRLHVHERSNRAAVVVEGPAAALGGGGRPLVLKVVVRCQR
jgi:hypothetical protein